MNAYDEIKFGWIRESVKNEKDYHKFKLTRNLNNITKVDLRSVCPPVLNQERLSSCVANAASAAFQFIEINQKVNNSIIPSRLFMYYNARVLEGDVGIDSGVQISNIIKTLKETGTCSETLWPYIINTFDAKPSEECYVESLLHKCTSSKRLTQTLQQMKQCLIEGFAFIIGFHVYESLRSDRSRESGLIDLPDIAEEEFLGGHAVIVVGFNDEKKVFIAQNSWGRAWGDAGYCYIPYAYLTNPDLADDPWVILSVTQN